MNLEFIMQRVSTALSVFLLLGAAEFTHAEDWPQILGQNRNGINSGEKLLDRWGDGGPKNLWTAKVGEGYAGPVVADGKVIAFHRVGGNERLEAFSATTGRSLWQADYPASYAGGIDADKGPRATAVVAGDRVFGFGAAGDLYCVALADGKKLWHRELYIDYDAKEGYFGAGTTPLVVGDKVIVNVGGDRSDAGIVALSVVTGKTVWKATSEKASYSSPVLVPKVEGRKSRELALVVTRLNLICINPADGEVVFRYPFGRVGPTVNAATPLLRDDRIFLSASYGIGALMLQMPVVGETPKVVWENESLSSQYVTAIWRGSYLYGIDGREDAGVGVLRCVAAETGKVLWSEEDFGIAHLVAGENKILALKVDGELVLVEPSPKSPKTLATAQIATGITRAIPALSNGVLYVRVKNATGGEIKAFQVGAP